MENNFSHKIYDPNLVGKFNSIEQNVEQANYEKIRVYTSFKDIAIEEINNLRKIS